MKNLVVLLSGKQGSGKTSTAIALKVALINHFNDKREYTFTYQNRFAEPLYQMHYKCRQVLQDFGITDYDYSKKDGNLLQLLGTEWGRKSIYDDIWVRCIQKFVEKETKENARNIFIIEDMRFENEFDGFPEGLKVRLEASEETRKSRAEMWRERTDHPSEIDLDKYAADGKFDMYLDAEGLTLDENVKIILDEVVRRTQ